jgi:1-acyl-sn-glycerol-3-phosphate acyltransferase
MAFGGHFWKTLATPRQGTVDVIFHEPVSVDAFASRKDLAAHCEQAVRSGVKAVLGGDYLG